MYRNKFATYLFCIAFTCLASTIASAQQLSVSFSTDTILIGDIFSIEATVNTQQGDKVFFPNFSDTIGKFEIIENHTEDTLENGFRKKWDVSVYEPGVYNMDGFSALLQRKSGKVDTLQNDEQHILYVKTVAVDTSKAYKPLKPAKNIPYPFKEVLKKYAWPLLVAIAVVVALFLFFYFRKKKKEEKVVVKTPLDFHKEALKRLKKIEKEKLWQNNKVKEYYLEISETLRTYIEGRYSVNAMESTTDEIISDLDGVLEPKAYIQKLKEILQQCDLAKFAKFKPSPEENTRLMKSSQDFVRHTKPKPVVEEPKNNA